MFFRAVLAFIACPATVAGVVPWLLVPQDPWKTSGTPVGAVVLALGSGVVLWCVRDFYVAGRGTLAPWAPPRRLVVVGLYRWTRNPMYIGVLLVIAGSALWAGSPLVGAYALALAAVFHVRVAHYEERWLASQFGPQWDAYRQAVPRWLPRFGPSPRR